MIWALVHLYIANYCLENTAIFFFFLREQNQVAVVYEMEKGSLDFFFFQGI